jgi:hypothetical protein
MHLIVPDRSDRRRASCPPMSAVGAAGGVRASGGRYGVRRRERRALALLQEGVVVGRESTPLASPVAEAYDLLLARHGDAKSRELHGSLGVATLTRLLGVDLLVLGGYPSAARITRASILAIAAQIVGWSFHNGLHRSDNRSVASSTEKTASRDRSGSGGVARTKPPLAIREARAELLPFSITRAAAHSRRARN